ncbi:hypothetical protein A2755_01440 [Candidatus Wolfebacteria bacterium RIFCSPHIGHO2_01_FULL_48_22]|uniref:RNA polymerase sigma factor 70 region 4 type 2 domain-containing protein n=2 Tax=Candidatus Wolfeibacteriota TaxID=1752735 RepID=A0A1F8DUU6_9BACT|nr:MAG: hypothetical protein A2755_01440 [Candidatus Wolfebacteria bacterium RIFCSPHIGHO2_01_FULL_48_22]OGM93890.1 MAG: hypothetical protein A2935_03345 [Candidatus Wolfebacteria bacterium RIFCSPLOWO2_01_FULL_47_17b]
MPSFLCLLIKQLFLYYTYDENTFIQKTTVYRIFFRVPMEGMTIKEIARAINQTQNNVSVRIHRGLRDLRTMLMKE